MKYENLDGIAQSLISSNYELIGINLIITFLAIVGVYIHSRLKKSAELTEINNNFAKVLDQQKTLTEEFTFNFEDERSVINSYSEPLAYLYEPNASVLKAGAFKSIAKQLKLSKLHQHSHLYTSSELVKNFPGRTFIINAVINADKKSLAKHSNGKANLACRNFPQKIDLLKKKLKLKDGGEDYIFATTLIDGKPKLIVCKKENNEKL